MYTPLPIHLSSYTPTIVGAHYPPGYLQLYTTLPFFFTEHRENVDFFRGGGWSGWGRICFLNKSMAFMIHNFVCFFSMGCYKKFESVTSMVAV